MAETIRLLALEPRLLRAHRVDRPSVGESQQVRAQSAPGGVEALRRLPEPDEDVLHRVLGQRLVAALITRSAIDGAIEGALLTGDDQIIVDMLDWQEKSLEAHDLDGSFVVEALAPPLAELSDEGSAALTRAREVRAG